MVAFAIAAGLEPLQSILYPFGVAEDSCIERMPFEPIKLFSSG